MSDFGLIILIMTITAVFLEHKIFGPQFTKIDMIFDDGPFTGYYSMYRICGVFAQYLENEWTEFDQIL